jgi:glycosyltransferase involved in cell wall biosynthesis
MSKNKESVSVVISTRKIDEGYREHVRKMFSQPDTEILMYENDGEMSLTQVYNKGLKESVNDIVVFMHDDLILETPNITPKIVKMMSSHSINTNYGIIGIAGTDKLTSGMWWQNRENMFGVVGHIHEGKRHVNHYSKGVFNEKLKDVVVVDGLFFMVHKGRLKKKFNEEFEGFHFYDISFCVENYLEGVKIGVTTKFSVTHKSIGIVNKQWEKNKLFFEALFDNKLPLEIS